MLTCKTYGVSEIAVEILFSVRAGTTVDVTFFSADHVTTCSHRLSSTHFVFIV